MKTCAICRVPKVHSEAIKTFGRVFVECHPRYSSFHNDFDGKQPFAECFVGHSTEFAEWRNDSRKKQRHDDGQETVTAALPSVMIKKHSASHSSFILGHDSFILSCMSL